MQELACFHLSLIVTLVLAPPQISHHAWELLMDIVHLDLPDWHLYGEAAQFMLSVEWEIWKHSWNVLR